MLFQVIFVAPSPDVFASSPHQSYYPNLVHNPRCDPQLNPSPYYVTVPSGAVASPLSHSPPRSAVVLSGKRTRVIAPDTSKSGVVVAEVPVKRTGITNATREVCFVIMQLDAIDATDTYLLLKIMEWRP